MQSLLSFKFTKRLSGRGGVMSVGWGILGVGGSWVFFGFWGESFKRLLGGFEVLAKLLVFCGGLGGFEVLAKLLVFCGGLGGFVVYFCIWWKYFYLMGVSLCFG